VPALPNGKIDMVLMQRSSNTDRAVAGVFAGLPGSQWPRSEATEESKKSDGHDSGVIVWLQRSIRQRQRGRLP
jgi:hypothetical protein